MSHVQGRVVRKAVSGRSESQPTKVEVMRFSFEVQPSDLGRSKFQELTVLDIFSAQPRNVFFSPISWRAAFGFKTPIQSRTPGPYLSGGAGPTYDFGTPAHPSWLSLFLNAEVSSNPDLSPQTPTTVGARVIATWFALPSLRFGLDGNSGWTVNEARWSHRIEIEGVHDLTRNLELRAKAIDSIVNDRSIREWQFGLFQHFLF